MAGNIVPRADGQANLGRADKEFDTIYAKNLGGTLADKIAMKDSPAFTGTPTAPTAAEGTQSAQLATTAFVQAANAGKADKTELSEMERLIKQYIAEELANYLPLSGGAIMTGNFIGKVNDSGSLHILSGRANNSGGTCLLFGQDNTDGRAGGFELRASKGGKSVPFLGKADGTLTWNNNPVATTNKLSMPSINNAIAIDNNTITNGYTAPCDGWLTITVQSDSLGNTGRCVAYVDNVALLNQYLPASAWNTIFSIPAPKGAVLKAVPAEAHILSVRFAYAQSAT